MPDKQIDFYEKFHISTEVKSYCNKIESELNNTFLEIDRMSEQNQLKVILAMQKERVSQECFFGSTGYGYDDLGRDTLERVYARIFAAEDALVRPQISCGTAAIALALFSNLRPGDELLSPAGRLYDTMDSVIGIRPAKGSLREYGITYRQTELLPDGSFDYPEIKKALNNKTKMVTIQRSRGYQSRPSFRIEEIRKLISFIRGEKPDCLIFVDNCYGEFVEDMEPIEAGADLVAGSLIKNPGGGLAPCGGYLAGKRECIENAANRLTSPGLGREVGASLGVNRSFFQGLFFAPTVVAGALKTAIFAAKCYETLGFFASPSPEEKRTDIIQAVRFSDPKALTLFCEGIQAGSPVDAHVIPEPSPMPGYADPVIMACGAFHQGSSIELSADGPLRPPYTAYFQGGLTWQSGKLGIMMSLQKLYENQLVSKEKLW